MKSTREQFKLFESEVWTWMARFGLTGWELYIDHEDSNRVDGSNAAIGFAPKDRTVTIWLHKNVEEPFDVKREAFHIVTHLFLGDFFVLAVDRHSSLESLVEEEHNIIQALGNLLCKLTSNP